MDGGAWVSSDVMRFYIEDVAVSVCFESWPDLRLPRVFLKLTHTVAYC
jgi:hypothetical protein